MMGFYKTLNSFDKSVPFCKSSEVLCYFGVVLCLLCEGVLKPGPVYKIVLKQLKKKVIYKILILTKCKMHIFCCTLSSEHPVCKYTDLILKVANCVSVSHYKELANRD